MRHSAEDVAVKAEFNYMLDQAAKNGWEDKINCHNRPDLFSDYRRIPTQEEAEALCKGCPMLELCRPYAAAYPPPRGVLGGVTWVDRKPFLPLAAIAA